MRNRTQTLTRTVTRLLRAAMVLATLPVAVLAGAGSAAADGTARAEPDTVTFGLLGPVGLAAVALGVVGMAAGVVRQRRRAQAAEERAAEQNTGTADVTVLAEESTRPSPTPVSRRTVA